MDYSEFQSLPSRPTEFVSARQRHKILPPGIYTGAGTDREFHNRHRTPPGLPPDATLVDCIAEVLRLQSPLSVAKIAQALNVEHGDIQLTLQRAPERFVRVRTKGKNGRGTLWGLK